MTDIVNVYRGKPGSSNVDGADGLGVTDVRGDIIDNPLYDVLKTNKLSESGSINFDRGSLASHNDRHHNNAWVRSSETTNYVPYAIDFTNWADTFSRWTRIGSTTDPDGGSTATEINLDVDTDALAGLGEVMESTVINSLTGSNLTLSFYMKVISGTVTSLDIGDGVETISMDTPTGDYQRITKTLNNTGTNFILSINPRGLTGARIAIYGVQLEDNNTATDLIITAGVLATEPFLGEIERESDKGWLIEQEKENVCHFSGDLSRWTPTNVTIATYSGEDPFGVTGENTRLVWGSVAEVSLSTTTETLTPSTAYTVSVWAYVLGGSLTTLTVSLGGGSAVLLPTVSTTGFTRIDVEVTSGATTGIVITGTSTNKTASLVLSGIQAEVGTLTSYLKTGSAGQTRLSDIVTCDIPFNIPKPSKPWTFRVRYIDVLDDANKKYIFTNNETGSTEFSCYFEDDNLTLKNGASETVLTTAFSVNDVVITCDGSNIKIYKNSTLTITNAITPTTFLAATLYIGMDSLEANAINAHLSFFYFFDVELTQNEITYLMEV